MSNYDSNNRGALFRNTKKAEGSKQPDYNGEAEINGKKLEIAAWMSKSKGGMTYMQLKFQEPRQKQAGDSDTAPRGKFDDMEQDIPF